MPFLAVGVEHKTTPLSIRERVAFDGEALEEAYRRIAALPDVEEAAIVSTCNRTEVYLFAADDADEVAVRVGEVLSAGDADVVPFLRSWRETEVIERLFRVAAGLESHVVGETQVLAQVRETLETAQRLEALGPNLHALFRAAINCARQARAGTALSRTDVSVAREAVREATIALGTLAARDVLIVGGGEISQSLAREVAACHPRTMFIANRTADVATRLAHELGGRAATLDDMPRLLPRVDVVFSATAASQYVLTAEDFPAQRDLLHIFDLAVPRDVDPSVAGHGYVRLHDLDSLLPAEVSEQWEADLRHMEGIIAAEVQEFMAWYLARRVAPVIASLRNHVELVAENELQRVAPQLRDLTDRERRAVESLTERLIDKMFHHLVLRLRLAAQTDPKLVEAAEFFFLHGEGGLFEHAAQAKNRIAVEKE